MIFCPGSGGWSYPRPNAEIIEKLPAVQLYNLKEDVAEENNLQGDKNELLEQYRSELAAIIKNGRSTPGDKQENDGEFPWKQIKTIVKE